jgi:hypothetical protein
VEFVYSSQVFHEGARSTWDSGEARALYILDLLDGKDLLSMHVYYDSDAHLISTLEECSVLHNAFLCSGGTS